MSLEIRRSNTKSVRAGHARPRTVCLAGFFAALCCAMTGCNGLQKDNNDVTTKPGPQKYVAPVVLGEPGGAGVTEVLETYLIDDLAKTFQQITYSLSREDGSQINNSGTTTVLQRNLLSLATTYTNPLGTAGMTVTPAQTGSWAFELANQAGGLVQLLGQPFTPLVATSACPSSSTPQTYQFVTIPDPLLVPSPVSQTVDLTFNPAVETGFGTVSVSATGGTVTLSNVAQHTLPAVSGSTGTPSNASPASATGICSSTPFGQTVSIPGQVAITNPGNGESVAASATIGIGPSGLLVEDNGATTTAPYQNTLGAGTGAIGLPQPTSALNTADVVGAQYIGFFYGSGVAGAQPSTPSGWSSSVASFGFSTTPASCGAVTSPTATLIYGGDFTNNDPSAPAVQAAGGFGNCDYAIDLGAQDSANNGLYPTATVWIGSSFAGNTTGVSYSFPAVAVAGQLGGKYAIFLLGVDTTGTPNQAQGIYLLQSN